MNKTWAVAIAIAWSILIGTTCLLPPSAFRAFSLQSIFELDKLIHLLIFFFFATFWLLSILPKEITVRHKIVVLVTGFAYGYVIEVIQNTDAVGRTFEWADIVADGLGTLLGVLLIHLNIKLILPLIKKRLPFIDKVY